MAKSSKSTEVVAEVVAEVVKVPHLNVPVSVEYLSSLKTWCDTHALPIDSEAGYTGRPSVAYAVMHLTADSVGYTLTDDDRTSGRSEVDETERKIKTAAKTIAANVRAGNYTADQLAMLKAMDLV